MCLVSTTLVLNIPNDKFLHNHHAAVKMHAHTPKRGHCREQKTKQGTMTLSGRKMICSFKTLSVKAHIMVPLCRLHPHQRDECQPPPVSCPRLADRQTRHMPHRPKCAEIVDEASKIYGGLLSTQAATTVPLPLRQTSITCLALNEPPKTACRSIYELYTTFPSRCPGTTTLMRCRGLDLSHVQHLVPNLSDSALFRG